MKQTAVDFVINKLNPLVNQMPNEIFSIICNILIEAKAMEKEYKANIRRAIADYMYSEGCACCEGKDHKDHAEKIAKLIDVPKYEDGSDYNFSQFRSN